MGLSSRQRSIPNYSDELRCYTRVNTSSIIMFQSTHYSLLKLNVTRELSASRDDAVE